MEEQAAVVRHLRSLDEETERLNTLCQRKLAELEMLKQSLLHHAFAGGL
jgi:type I restriction enzyme, S subunit